MKIHSVKLSKQVAQKLSEKLSNISAVFVLLVFLFATSIASISLPKSALAYSGTGLGTLQNPYKIASCEQLQDIQSNLGGHYKLISDIDCSATSLWNSGAGFEPITAFTGVLDGQNFSINNLYQYTAFSDAALFANTNGATIKNIHLRGGSFNSSNSGLSASFVAAATNTIFSNCSSTISVLVSVSGYAAGLVGAMIGGSMDSCWYDGTVVSRAAFGAGIASLAYGDAVITNVYSKGSITETGAYAAGLIGELYGTASVTNAYSTANVVGGGYYAGGLFTTDGSASITSVYYAGVLTPGLGNAGAIIGFRGSIGPFIDAYYDSYICGCITGVGLGTDIATSINGGNATPNYFKNNSTNAPFTGWDFTSVWQTNAGEHPTLRSGLPVADGDSDHITNIVENNAPNSGDSNDDGLADLDQGNVSTFLNATSGKYTTVQTSCAANYNVQNGGEANDAKDDVGYDYPAGLAAFVGLNCGAPGSSVTVTLYYYGTYDASKLVLRKSNGTAYSTISGATLTNLTIGGQAVLKAVYQVVDGGPLDQDGVADGNIVDPVGIALSVVGAPNTGLKRH